MGVWVCVVSFASYGLEPAFGSQGMKVPCRWGAKNQLSRGLRTRPVSRGGLKRTLGWKLWQIGCLGQQVPNFPLTSDSSRTTRICVQASAWKCWGWSTWIKKVGFGASHLQLREGPYAEEPIPNLSHSKISGCRWYPYEGPVRSVVRLFVCLFVCLFVRLFVRLFVCLCLLVRGLPNSR